MRLLFLLFILPFLLNAETNWEADLQEPFKLTIQFHSQQLTLSDSLDLEAEFHYPSSYQLDIDALIEQLIWSANPLTPQWNLLQSKSTFLKAKEGMQVQRLILKLNPLITGQIEISFLTVTFQPKAKAEQAVHVSTPIFSFNILQSIPLTDTLAFAPLIPLEPQFPLELTQANRELLIDNPKLLEKTKQTIQHHLEAHSFPWLILVILLACGGLGWTIYLTREKWPKRSTKSIASFSPKQQIDQALQDLQKRQFNQDQAQIYYAELASILLDALQVRLGLKTQKLTTVELSQAMKKESSISPQQVEEALSLLTQIDQVKFAGKKPLQAEVTEMSRQVQTFVRDLLTRKFHNSD